MGKGDTRSSWPVNGVDYQEELDKGDEDEAVSAIRNTLKLIIVKGEEVKTT